ncbi:hypothetical protein BASA81_014502 [Batrachochytrium salamandrivorans]|nr:hypothetical protein BASA81_014502 [Batrachochytrium salamandrivorans]
MFEYVAPNVQVNGIEFDKAFEDVQEYEPCDEGLRKEADDLQNNVQNTLVRTTQMRREAPQQLDVMISESIQILTDITEKAMIIEPEIPARQPVPEFGIPAPEFSETMRDYTDVAAAHGIVSKFVIPKLHKAKRAQETLDSLKVPPASEITISIPRKSQTPRANRRQSSVAKYAVTPRTARFGLLRRLEAEVQQSPHEDGESYNKSLIENHQDVGNEMHY